MGNLQSLINSASNVSANAEKSSAATLLSSIAVSFAAFAAQVLVFVLLRIKLSRIYRPKSYLVPERQRVPIPPSGLISWLRPVFAATDMTLIQKCGLDAYFFLRYLKLLLKIFVPAGCLILPILLPVNATGGGDQSQLNVLNITNVDSTRGERYWAHCVCAVGFIIWVSYVIYKELRGYVRVRQAYITSPQHRIRASATTVLVTGIPKRWLTLEALEGLYDVFPGGIRNIWINRNYDELSTKVQKRDQISKQLESAETNLIRLCRKKHQKSQKASGKHLDDTSREMTPIRNKERSQDDADTTSISQEQLLRESIESPKVKDSTAPEHISGSKLIEGITFWRKHTGIQGEVTYDTAYNKGYDQVTDEEAKWRQYMKPKERETMRLPLYNQGWLGWIPFTGKKVDRIYHLRAELARLNLEIKTDQGHAENFPKMNSAFIQFNHQVAAHMACQSVNHHVPLTMAPRIVEISPDDIIWDNLSIKWWERYLRTLAVFAISVALIIFYAIPVTFSAALNNLTTIGQTYPSLAFLDNLSQAAKGIIQGIAPPLLVTLVLLLVPMIYGFLIKLGGVPTGNARELGVQNWYFAFLFIQVFLVASIASGLLKFFQSFASNPNQIAETISQTLPQAANYFLSYICVQAFGNSAGALLQIFTLLIWFLLSPLVDSTPRDKWRRQTDLSNVQWGSFFPPFTNFAVIGIIYGCIAPLIIPFVILIFALFWLVYKYNVLYVYIFKHDTGGLLFPSALNQLFVGIYFQALCLIGLFFTARDAQGNSNAYPQGIIMVIVLVFCIIYQWLLNTTFGPLLRYMPITLEDDAVIRDEEFARAQASKWTADHAGNDDVEEGDIQDQLRDKEAAEQQADQDAEAQEKHDIEIRRKMGTSAGESTSSDQWHAVTAKPRKTDPWKKVGGLALKPVKGVVELTTRTEDILEQSVKAINEKARLKEVNDKLGQNLKVVNERTGLNKVGEQLDSRIAGANGLALASNDPEAQAVIGDILFSGLADELEDLTPDERDVLVRYAFRHSALRARQPIVWIPQDELGVSDDEIRRAKKLSNHIAMSNIGSHLDAKGKVVFDRSPPDFSNTDLIAL